MKASVGSDIHSGHVSFWTDNALKNLKKKKLKNYLVVLCYNKELFKLGKNLEKMHIFLWKELRKCFISK